MHTYRPVVATAALCTAVLPTSFALAQDAPAKVYDVKAEALLQKSADRLLAAQSFSGQVMSIITSVAVTSGSPATQFRTVRVFRLQKPNLVYQEIGNQKQDASGKWITTPSAKYVSDGKTGAFFSQSTKTYRKMTTTPDALGTGYNLNFPEFFSPKISDAQQARDDKASGNLVSLTMAPDETFAGVPCTVVVEKNIFGKNKNGVATSYRTTKIYVGKKDDIIRGYHSETPYIAAQTSEDVLTNVVLDSKIPASVFAVNTTGYKPYVAPKRAPEPALMTAGTMAPDFTAYDKDGKAVKLSDLKGKIVVLDFWATWCGPCMKSLPHTTDVAKKTADKGVVVFAVNVWDKKEEFDKWLPQHPEYSPLQFVIDTTPGQGQDVATKLYKVSGIPTQYVIDRNGKIVTSFVGFGGPTSALEDAIAKADAAGTAVAQK